MPEELFAPQILGDKNNCTAHAHYDAEPSARSINAGKSRACEDDPDGERGEGDVGSQRVGEM